MLFELPFVACGMMALGGSSSHHNGLNFAATQGNSNTGNFLPGVGKPFAPLHSPELPRWCTDGEHSRCSPMTIRPRI